MNYNINFCILSAAYLFITTIFYRRQVRVKSRRSVLFAAMLTCCIISLVLDIAAAAIDPYAYLLPAWIIYVVNILFLLSTQLSGVLFFYYSISLTGTYTRMDRWAKILIILPFAATAVLLLISPFTSDGIFYLDEKHIYHHGAFHLALYISMAVYLLSSLAIVFSRRHSLQKLKFYTILAFLLATLAAMLIQLNYPYLLVNSAANAFSLMLIYYILEAPSAHVDALTRVFNRAAFSPMLCDFYEEGERFSLLLYSLDALHIINHSCGMKGGDEALIEFASYLKQTHPKGSIFRIEGNAFCVLLRGGEYIDADRLAHIYANTKSVFAISSGDIGLDTSVACINSEDCDGAVEFSALLDSLMQQHREGKFRGALLADDVFKAQLQKQNAIEKATQRALDEGRIEVYYQPIHDSSGRLCALEALVRVVDEKLGPLPTQELVELAEKNGSIMRLGEQVLRKTCEFMRDHEVASWGLDHVGVNLSALQCVQSELPERVAQILSEYSLPEGLIVFEVTETVAGVLAIERANMERLCDKGVQFLLDDFGTGYANFRNMTALPYHCIKLDKSLLWSAQKSAEQMRLLSGVVKVVHNLGLTSLCEGVETEQQVELLTSLGVSMLQGYYFSKPLPPRALLEYAKKAGVC